MMYTHALLKLLSVVLLPFALIHLSNGPIDCFPCNWAFSLSYHYFVHPQTLYILITFLYSASYETLENKKGSDICDVLDLSMSCGNW